MDSADNQFDTLRKLLALKRHEQPPPGYFDRLPERILDRIAAQPSDEPADWLGRLAGYFRVRPALVGAFGIVLGASYLLGLGYAGRVAPEPADPVWLVEGRTRVQARRPVVWEAVPAPTLARGPGVSSVAPVIHAGTSGSFFPHARLQALDRVERAAYTPLPR